MLAASTWIWLLPPPLADVFLLCYILFLPPKPAVPNGCRFGLILQQFGLGFGQLRARGAAERGHLNAVKLANAIVS